MALFVNIFSSALTVLSPNSGGLSILSISEDSLIGKILRFYRKRLLPSPLSDVITIGSIEERKSLRPGVDSEELIQIMLSSDSTKEIREQIISYNSGCIQGNEQLIRDNRERLSEIYSLGVVATLTITISIGMIIFPNKVWGSEYRNIKEQLL